MRRIVTLLVLCCGLAMPAAAADENILRVETAIAGRVTNRWGEPMRWPNGTQIVFFKLFGKRWDEKLWARMTFMPDAAGRFTAIGIFPIDPNVTRFAVQNMANRTVMNIDTGVQVLTADGQVMPTPDGVCIELMRFGVNPWVPGVTAKLVGMPDDQGRMWPKMEMPINDITRRNFTLLAEGRGR